MSSNLPWINDFEKPNQRDVQVQKAQVNESKINIVVSSSENNADILPAKLDVNELLKLPSII